MSQAIIVILAAHQLPTRDAWQAALQEHRVPLRFPHPLDLARDSGFVPVELNGHDSGFWLYRNDYSELILHYPALSKIELDAPTAFSLKFGGDFFDCASAAYAAALLIARFKAVAFDPQEAAFLSEPQLVEMAQLCQVLERPRCTIAQTRQAQKEVLSLRPKLGLVDGFFYQKPVEHILCGFLHEHGSAGGYICRFALPLYECHKFLSLNFSSRLPGDMSFWEDRNRTAKERAAEFVRRIEPYEAETYAPWWPPEIPPPVAT